MEDDAEADASAAFFDLLEDNSWTLPRGDEALHVRPLTTTGDRDADVGGTLIVAFSSSGAHLDFEATLGRLRDEATRMGDSPVHGLLVSDAEFAWFVRTPSSDEEDEYSAVVGLVRREVLRHRPRRLLTLGYCRGGYAAVRCGVALHAHRVLAFSPTCYLQPAQRRHRRLPACYFDSYLDSLSAHAEHAGLDALHEAFAAAVAASAAEPTLQWQRERATQPRDVDEVAIELHVGGDDDADVLETAACLDDWHAHELHEAATRRDGADGRAAPAPKLRLSLTRHVHPGCGHELPVYLKQAGQLVPLLRKWAATPSPP